MWVGSFDLSFQHQMFDLTCSYTIKYTDCIIQSMHRALPQELQSCRVADYGELS